MDWKQPGSLEAWTRLLLPYAETRRDVVIDNKIRFSHYTSADAATKLLASEEVWLRNALVMNDFSEVHYGRTCLLAAWNDELVGGRLRALLDALRPGLHKTLVAGFERRIWDQVAETYLISISEHEKGDEDFYGRLSMWRAYGGATNVAFIMNNQPFTGRSNAIKAYTSPVLYTDPPGFTDIFRNWVMGLEGSRQFLTSMPPERIVSDLIEAFHFFVLSTKHPGFKEEREWRVLYSPTIHRSDVIIEDFQTLGGVPQRIYKIPLRNIPDRGFVGASIPEILDRIIIGPTQYPLPMVEAFVDLLIKKEVPNARERIFVSNVPLRR